MTEIIQKRKVALVTGGASGIGKAISEKLVSEGFSVVITDIDTEKGMAVAESIGCLFIHSDLRHEEACANCVSSVVHKAGGLDILINNAGVQHICSIENFPEEKWESMLRLMLFSPFLLMKYAWPFLKSSGSGRIINMGSIHSTVASSNKSAYIAAKHGLAGLTKAASIEGGAYGITANSICPAYVKTPLVEEQIENQIKENNIQRNRLETDVFFKNASVKRFISPDEVAYLVSYLCSANSGAVTGAIWNMDLGWTAQ